MFTILRVILFYDCLLHYYNYMIVFTPAFIMSHACFLNNLLVMNLLLLTVGVVTHFLFDHALFAHMMAIFYPVVEWLYSVLNPPMAGRFLVT